MGWDWGNNRHYTRREAFYGLYDAGHGAWLARWRG